METSVYADCMNILLGPFTAGDGQDPIPFAKVYSDPIDVKLQVAARNVVCIEYVLAIVEFHRARPIAGLEDILSQNRIRVSKAIQQKIM